MPRTDDSPRLSKRGVHERERRRLSELPRLLHACTTTLPSRIRANSKDHVKRVRA